MNTNSSQTITWGITATTSVFLILAGGWRIYFGNDLAEKLATETLYWFVAAALVLLVPRVKSISFGGAHAEIAELEEELLQSRELTNAVVDQIRAQALLGSMSDEQTPDAMLAAKGITRNSDKELDDPWQGRFGGRTLANRRSLSASVESIRNEPEWFLIHLRVTAGPASPALTGPVYFYLHDSFPMDRMMVKPANGQAELRLKAWGAFTVGVIADGGETLLELNLAENKEFPALFRSR